MIRRVFLAMFVAMAAACAPVQQFALSYDDDVKTGFSDYWFTSFDGAKLGLTVHHPAPEADAQPESGPSAARQDIIIVAVHGMNDYAGAFNAAGTWWAAHGATVYAYDQRGFGRSPGSGIWPDEDVMQRDLKTAVKVARERHPGAKVAVVGESMGASVAITTFADDDPPDADALILSGPGLRGWGTLPWLYSVSLWTSAHVRPAWVVVPPKGVRITPTDNNEKLREMWLDPNVQKTNRIDSVYGVVSIMEDADAKIARLPKSIPTLLTYGAHDEVIPPNGVQRAARKLPAHVKTAYYAKGYHMLMNDLQAETAWSDILSFIQNPAAPLPSGSPPLPWKRETPAKR